MFSHQKKTCNDKETNQYPLRLCHMALTIVVLMSAGHVVALSLD
jgi:hypothetical protein